ncbi:hypothetical protein [Polyangium jinanense]|uniref:Uncharacterized protein n=1 Tax=Polyangium jinanense TaxID=2829994 RepID=A0A9X4B040_9BACT|nr:hypothetical protein [Polyangium jinanense]MDC3988777.1 hypothetical protein [Polyangium jinanense]
MKFHLIVVALAALVGIGSVAEATVAAPAEGHLDEDSNPSDVGADDFELRAVTPPGGSWNRTCKQPGSSIPGGFCAECRRVNGSYVQSCIYTRRCPSWCADNIDGTLRCSGC